MSSPETVRSRSARCSAAIAFISANQAGPWRTAFLISAIITTPARANANHPSGRASGTLVKAFPSHLLRQQGGISPQLCHEGIKQRHIDVGTSLERADRRDPFRNVAAQTPIG